MKFILRKILSDKQFTNLQIHLIEHAASWIFAIGTIVIVLPLFLFFRPQNYLIQGYELAKVLSIQDTTSDSGFSVLARIELDDGGFGFASTKSIVIASDAVTTICVEVREFRNGRQQYHWVHKRKCDKYN